MEKKCKEDNSSIAVVWNAPSSPISLHISLFLSLCVSFLGGFVSISKQVEPVLKTDKQAMVSKYSSLPLEHHLLKNGRLIAELLICTLLSYPRQNYPVLAIYGHMIYMAMYVMFLMRANPLRGQEGGGLVPGNRDIFSLCEMASKCRFGPSHLPS